MKLANKIELHYPQAVDTIDCISAVYFMHYTVPKRSKKHILYTPAHNTEMQHIPPFCEASIAFPAPVATHPSDSIPPPLIRALKLCFYCCIGIVLSHPPSAITPFRAYLQNAHCRTHFKWAGRSNSRIPFILHPHLIVVYPRDQKLGTDAALHTSASAPIMQKNPILVPWSLAP